VRETTRSVEEISPGDTERDLGTTEGVEMPKWLKVERALTRDESRILTGGSLFNVFWTRLLPVVYRCWASREKRKEKIRKENGDKVLYGVAEMNGALSGCVEDGRKFLVAGRRL
jgi:hypothetical protein